MVVHADDGTFGQRIPSFLRPIRCAICVTLGVVSASYGLGMSLVVVFSDPPPDPLPVGSCVCFLLQRKFHKLLRIVNLEAGCVCNRCSGISCRRIPSSYNADSENRGRQERAPSQFPVPAAVKFINELNLPFQAELILFILSRVFGLSSRRSI